MLCCRMCCFGKQWENYLESTRSSLWWKMTCWNSLVLFRKDWKLTFFFSVNFGLHIIFLSLLSFLFNWRQYLLSSPLPNYILADCFFAGNRFLLGCASREEAIAVLKEVWDDIKNDTKLKSCDVSARICVTLNKYCNTK